MKRNAFTACSSGPVPWGLNATYYREKSCGRLLVYNPRGEGNIELIMVVLEGPPTPLMPPWQT